MNIFTYRYGYNHLKVTLHRASLINVHINTIKPRYIQPISRFIAFKCKSLQLYRESRAKQTSHNTSVSQVLISVQSILAVIRKTGNACTEKLFNASKVSSALYFFFIIIYPKQKSQGKNNKKKQILNACHLSGMFKGMNFVPLIREHIIQHSGAKWF